MKTKPLIVASGLWMMTGIAAAAQQTPQDLSQGAGSVLSRGPMSAIDWLSESASLPAVVLPGIEQAVTDSATPGIITVQPLDTPNPDATGLLPPSVTGLPRTLWNASNNHDLIRRIENLPVGTLPALNALSRQLLLAEADAPLDADGSFLLARIDALLSRGSLDDAQALIERAGPGTPELFRRWFDVALLTGTEASACETLRLNGSIAPSYQARIFCLARNGDWAAAALTLNSAEALGYISGAEYELIAWFLDPELFEGEEPGLIIGHPSPLEFRMREAIGEPLDTSTLPLAFSQADLRSNIGWKPRVEASERLARVGAIDDNQLLGIYSERSPAASGGVWERVDAVQRFDFALSGRDAGAIAETLPDAWAAMQGIGLERSFARLYGAALSEVRLDPDTHALAFRVGLFSDRYEYVATNYAPRNTGESFLSALAQGDPASVTPGSPLATAIQDGFDSGPAPDDLARLLERGELGSAILDALTTLAHGAEGDLAHVSDMLRFFRSIGMEDTARQAALQLLLTEARRG